MMDQIIEFADIGEHIDSPIKHYSSGMYVRLGFAVAVMVKPDILIVDEVIAVGDEEFQRRCFDHLHELRLRGTTMVIVSHGMGLITDLCDEAVWMEHGRVQDVGPVRGVTAAYMDRVNLREAERVAAEAGEGTPHDHEPARMPRLGSGEVRVERVELLDASGAPSRVVISGEPMKVRMHYRATQAVPDAVFGIGFKHESGVFTAGPNSGRFGGWDLVEGTGHVDFDVESSRCCREPSQSRQRSSIVATRTTSPTTRRISRSDPQERPSPDSCGWTVHGRSAGWARWPAAATTPDLLSRRSQMLSHADLGAVLHMIVTGSPERAVLAIGQADALSRGTGVS